MIGLLQDLRNFTVQIRTPDHKAIMGTGVAVSNDGQIVTCAHVVQAALNVKRRPQAGEVVGVYFAQVRGGEKKERAGTVARVFDRYDDDVVLLELRDGPPPLAPEQIAVVGHAGKSEGHEFRSYGYQRLEAYIAGRAEGKIYGSVEPPPDRAVQADPVQLKSNEINKGMSGAAVLDIQRNLVVGLISETWWPDKSTKNSDTAWAVDGRVLSLDPLNLPVREEDLPFGAAPTPKTDIAQAQAALAPAPGVDLSRAPAPLAEWVGRADLLAELDDLWRTGRARVAGLIGFGGEGKSSLARRWVDSTLTPGPVSDRPETGEGRKGEGVFWWGFYENPSADAFFEAALNFMSEGRVDPRLIPGANVRAQVLAAMLPARRVLFVLDGVEVMQENEGDRYGAIKNGDLREFLELWAGTAHNALCLLTSRAPVFDLQRFPAYRHLDVERLSPADGRDLLRALGVQDDDAALDAVVQEWDGHALTLTLLGSYLKDAHGGDLSRLRDLPPPTADENRYQRVQRVLRRYDEHLTPAQQEFLKIFSAFRTPVKEEAFEKVFSPSPRPSPEGTALREMGEKKPDSPSPDHAVSGQERGPGGEVLHLLTTRLLRYDPTQKHYTAHPLVRAHYLERLQHSDRAEVNATHTRIKDYYLALATDTPTYPTLNDLQPLIEVVHHLCQAGAYDEGFQIHWERIYQTTKRVIIHQLGAYETNLAIMLEFFPDGDTAQDPAVTDANDKRFILNAIGFCLMSLGRLSTAVPFYERKNVIALNMQDWRNASVGYQNLAELHAYLGVLAASAEAAAEALTLARRAQNKQSECASLARQAWTAHLRGDAQAVRATFAQAEALEREITPQVRYLYSLRGIQHADHLRRTGEADYARAVTEANQKICEQAHWPDDLSRSHRVLGDLDADAGQLASAQAHYDAALKIARGISDRAVLIEALLGRGRFYARYARHLQDPASARSDLNEALGYALAGSYRVYECDIRIGLAWAALAAKEAGAAQAEADRAAQLAEEIGYHWGKVDAAEVMGVIGERG